MERRWQAARLAEKLPLANAGMAGGRASSNLAWWPVGTIDGHGLVQAGGGLARTVRDRVGPRGLSCDAAPPCPAPLRSAYPVCVVKWEAYVR